MTFFASLHIQPVKDDLMKAWFINLSQMKAIFKYSLLVQPFLCEELCANLYWFWFVVRVWLLLFLQYIAYKLSSEFRVLIAVGAYGLVATLKINISHQREREMCEREGDREKWVELENEVKKACKWITCWVFSHLAQLYRVTFTW